MERGILFKGELVRAILAGTKTQTRRLVAITNSYVDGHAPWIDPNSPGAWPRLLFGDPAVFADKGPSPAGNPGPYLHVPDRDRADGNVHRVYPRFFPGDRLWVREAWRARLDQDELAPRDLPQRSVWYCATGNGHGDEEPSGCSGGLGKKRPGMFMPRWASRITLEITDVRVQRLQEISEEDANAEGCPEPPADQSWTQCRRWFERSWDHINGSRAPWKSNPWVWCLTFRRA